MRTKTTCYTSYTFHCCFKTASNSKALRNMLHYLPHISNNDTVSILYMWFKNILQTKRYLKNFTWWVRLYIGEWVGFYMIFKYLSIFLLKNVPRPNGNITSKLMKCRYKCILLSSANNAGEHPPDTIRKLKAIIDTSSSVTEFIVRSQTHTEERSQSLALVFLRK
jgi:DNA polymerase III alpha subunit (gram-positive type)